MDVEARIYVAGGNTLLGAALLRLLERRGYRCLPGPEPDLARQDQVEAFFAHHRPAYVFVAAGKSGGIGANRNFPADLMLDNLLVTAHVLAAAHRHGVKKLVYLASSCCYPRDCTQPMRVEDLCSGPLEPTSEAYATAKIAGIQLCWAYRRQYGSRFISAIAADAYGPGDSFDAEDAHVIGALMRRMHMAKKLGQETVTIWGTGTPRRQFIFADDLAEACVLVMERYEGEQPINLGTGHDHSIRELAETLREIVGFCGRLVFDASRPDGMPQKSLDAQPLRDLGWQPRTSLHDGLAATWQWFLKHETSYQPDA